MATYKEKNKRNSNGKFIAYVMIGFAIAFFAILIALIIYNSNNNTFDDSPLLNMPEEQYLVYLYSDSCSHCLAIKDDVAAFSSGNAADMKLYYLNSSDLRDGEFQYLSDTYGAGGTPAMFTIVDGKVVDLLLGSLEIPNTFDAINNGTYSKIK